MKKKEKKKRKKIKKNAAGYGATLIKVDLALFHGFSSLGRNKLAV